MIDLSKEKFIVWGFKNGPYDTYKHIQEAFYRALKLTGKQVLWLDAADDISGIDFSDCFFITQNDVVAREVNSMPLRNDCLYAVHNNIQGGKERFVNLDVVPFGVQLAGIPDYVEETRSVNFPWATDLLPHEIEKNKPSRVFRSDSKVINYVGSVWEVNRAEISLFSQACEVHGISFKNVRGGVSIEENVRFIQESYMAPALIGVGHPFGYIPCRVFKNISYGQMGVTNSPHINDLFDGRLIFNFSPYLLFCDAKEKLPEISLRQLHSLMDLVAQKHTYLNRIESLLKGARILLESK